MGNEMNETILSSVYSLYSEVQHHGRNYIPAHTLGFSQKDLLQNSSTKYYQLRYIMYLIILKIITG